jgi:hypothetical protein
MDLLSCIVLCLVLYYFFHIDILALILLLIILQFFGLITINEPFEDDMYSFIPEKHISPYQYNRFVGSGYGKNLHWSKRFPEMVNQRYSYDDSPYNLPCSLRHNLYSSGADFANLHDLPLNMSKYIDL